MRSRKRRSNRCAEPDRLDQYVVMFAYGEGSKPLRERRFRSVVLRVALQMVRDGDAMSFSETTENGWVTFFSETREMVGAVYVSPATLTKSTMDAVALRAGGDRLTRRQRDQVERFDVWALVGDTKAVAVRPRLSDAERKRAEALLGYTQGHRLDGHRRCPQSRRTEVRTMHFELPAAA